jgi:predicted urease superfamily metal-dependent hydrolase
MTQDMVVNIGPDGKMHVETFGYVGPACEKAIQDVMEAAKSRGLGVEVTHKEKKPEYDMPAAYGDAYESTI